MKMESVSAINTSAFDAKRMGYSSKGSMADAESGGFRGETQSRLHAKLFVRKNAFRTMACILFLVCGSCTLQ
ncbi:hypothetical protein QNM99_06130 [Pseudomonas sp. PCH446]